jgi:hypothetical protein
MRLFGAEAIELVLSLWPAGVRLFRQRAARKCFKVGLFDGSASSEIPRRATALFEYRSVVSCSPFSKQSAKQIGRLFSAHPPSIWAIVARRVRQKMQR